MGRIVLLGCGTASVGGAAAVTWNPADKDTGIALTGSNLIATRSTAYDGGFIGVRATTGHSTGKYCFKATVTSPNTSEIGIGNATPGLASNPSGSSDLLCWASGGGLVGATGSGPINAYIDGDILTIAIDLGAKLFWGKVNSGNWNNLINGATDPAAGTGGVSFSGINAGPYLPISFFLVQNAAFTLDFAPASPPSGFGNW